MFQELKNQIKRWAKELGFTAVGITDAEVLADKQKLTAWLEQGFHGQMRYMEKWLEKRFDPAQLLPQAKSVIMVIQSFDQALMAEKNKKTNFKIAHYAWGRDYHKIFRAQFKKLISKIENETGKFGYRFFVDSAPILEKALAQRAGLGWIGKHTLLVNPNLGSFFMLGGICTDLALQSDEALKINCGNCERCLKACPTQALISPYQLDARRCIAYLTMEYDDVIPYELASKMGARIFGCDECQLACPWNQLCKQKNNLHSDFSTRKIWLTSDLKNLFYWSEEEFLKYTEGSSIRRIGYQRFIRNVVIALINAGEKIEVNHPLEIVRRQIEAVK